MASWRKSCRRRRPEVLIEPHGAAADSGLIHGVYTTVASGADVAHAHAGYTGLNERPEITRAPQGDELRMDVRCNIALKRCALKVLPEAIAERWAWRSRTKKG